MLGDKTSLCVRKREKGDSELETILKVEGMMCHKCEATVKRAVSSLEGVTNVDVKLEEQMVRVTYDESVELDDIKEAIEDQGYDVID